MDSYCQYGPPDTRADSSLFVSTDNLPVNQNDDQCFQLEVAQAIENLNRLAYRFGCPHLCETQTVTHPRKGLEILGRFLAWAEKQLPEAELLTAEQVADMLGVSTRTIWRRVSSGEIPEPMRIGGLTKWRRSEIEEIVNG